MNEVRVIWPAILCIGIICLLCVFEIKSEIPNDDNQFCTVTTNNGRIRGKLNQTLFDQMLYYSFRGIPFAKPPIGNLRFKVNKQLQKKFNGYKW